MRRRDFLALGGVTAAGAALAACTSTPRKIGARAAKTTTTTSRSLPSTTVKRPNSSDWASLGRELQGHLVRPGDSDYLVAAESYNPIFDGARPAAIAYVSSPAEVVATLAFSRQHGMALSTRSGGHCYGGWSTGSGLVVDVSRLSTVRVSGGQARVGSGTRLIDLYNACAPHGVTVPGGSCPTVGIAGLALGGGLGVLDRKFGLTCDNMLEAEVVLASGQVVTCNASSNPDLFWALRGAGGGNFGVVTDFTFRTHPVGELAIFTLVWEWQEAAAVLREWQRWAPKAPDELWSNCLLLASQDTPSGEAPTARVTGVYVGTEQALEAELAPFLSAVGSSPFDRFVGTSSYLHTMLIEAGCDGKSVAECHLPSQDAAGQLGREPFVARSDIVTAPLSSAAISTLLAAVTERESSPVLSGGGVALDAAGGAINRVPDDATAYVHRNGLYTMQYSGSWNEGSSPGIVSANKAWLARTWSSMRPYVSGQAYQNYIDPNLKEWESAYYGANLARLKEVKARYDPNDVFHFPQSIPLDRP